MDQALLTAQDRFAVRVSIYSLRSLKQVAQETEMAIAQLTPQQIANWVENDPSLTPQNGFDESFRSFFSRLVLASLKPLKQIAQEAGAPVEALSVAQVIAWFEAAAKARIAQEREATS